MTDYPAVSRTDWPTARGVLLVCETDERHPRDAGRVERWPARVRIDLVYPSAPAMGRSPLRPVRPTRRRLGKSAFSKDADCAIFQIHSASARSVGDGIGTRMILNRAPNGRTKDKIMDVVRRHHDDQTDVLKADGV